MATEQYNSLIPEVRAEVPLASSPQVERTLRTVAREFCELSESYLYIGDPLSIIKGLTTYTLDKLKDTEVVKIISVYYEGRPLEPTSQILLGKDRTAWREDTGPPRKFIGALGSTIELYPVPSTTEAVALTVEVALRPTRISKGLEALYMDENADYLIAGTIARLQVMSGTPWYAPDMASYHMSVYQRGIMTAKSKAYKDNTPKMRVTKYGGY